MQWVASGRWRGGQGGKAASVATDTAAAPARPHPPSTEHQPTRMSQQTRGTRRRQRRRPSRCPRSCTGSQSRRNLGQQWKGESVLVAVERQAAVAEVKGGSGQTVMAREQQAGVQQATDGNSWQHTSTWTKRRRCEPHPCGCSSRRRRRRWRLQGRQRGGRGVVSCRMQAAGGVRALRREACAPCSAAAAAR